MRTLLAPSCKSIRMFPAGQIVGGLVKNAYACTLTGKALQISRAIAKQRHIIPAKLARGLEMEAAVTCIPGLIRSVRIVKFKAGLLLVSRLGHALHDF